MKPGFHPTWRRYALLLLISLTPFFSAQAQNITDSNNAILATQSGDSLLDTGGEIMFFLDASGTVHNPDGSVAGNFDSQNNIFDVNGAKVGELAGNGKVRDLNDDLLGQINSNGTVTDANGDLMANYSNVSEQALAWFQFFGSSLLGF